MNKKDLIIYIILAYLLYNHFFCKETFSLESGTIPGNLSIDGNLYVKGAADIKETLGVHKVLYAHAGGEFKGNTTFSKPTSFQDQISKKWSYLNYPTGGCVLRTDTNIEGNLDYNENREAIINLIKLAKNLTKDGKLMVPGGLYVKGNLQVEGNSQLDKQVVVGNLVAKNDLYVKGAADITKTLGVHGILNAHAGGQFDGNTTFSKPTSFQDQKSKKWSWINYPTGGSWFRTNVGIQTQSSPNAALRVNGEGQDYSLITLEGNSQLDKQVEVVGNLVAKDNLYVKGGADIKKILDVHADITSKGQSILKNNDPIKIKRDGNYLNSTMLGSGNIPNDFAGWTYWINDGNNVDSKLNIIKR